MGFSIICMDEVNFNLYLVYFMHLDLSQCILFLLQIGLSPDP